MLVWLLTHVTSHEDVGTLFDAEKPQVALMGATSVGRDLGPRVSSALHSGLTADCTSLEIGEYTDAKSGKKYENCYTRFVRPLEETSWPDREPGMSSADGHGSRGCDEERNLQSSTSGRSEEIERGRVSDDTDLVVRVIELTWRNPK